MEGRKALSKISGTDRRVPLIMPGDVRAVHVISLVEEIGELGTEVHLTALAERINADIAVLLPILDAAEMLGLVARDKGDAYLTETGLKLQGTTMAKVSIMRDRLAAMEPFRTAIDLASKNGSTTAEAIAGTLSEEGILWHYKDERNESIIRDLLIHWAIRARLLSYDGKTGRFRNYRPN